MPRIFRSSLISDKVAYILIGATVFIVLEILLINLAVKSPYLALSFTLGLIVVLLLSTSPLKALTSIVFIIPFTGTALLNGSMIQIPGAKPLQVLALFAVCIAVFNYKKALPIPNYLFFFILAILTLFIISLIRSLPHLNVINNFFLEQLSPLRFMLSNFIKPLILFMPLIIIVKFAQKKEDIKFIVNMVCYSILALSCLIVYLYFFQCPDRGNVGKVREFFQIYFGFHTNSLVNFYIVAFPLIISNVFLSKNIINILNVVASTIAIGFLYSRSAYAVFLIAIILYFIISKRKKIIPLLVALAVLLFVFAVPESIIERGSKGIGASSKKGDDISAGRVDYLWIPLIDEYSKDPKKIILGAGRYAILFSESARKGKILSTKHPHNMYLEQIFDAGLIGLAIFLLFYFVLIRKLYNCLGKIKDHTLKEYHYAVFVSLLCYLISGVTGRTFFPATINGYLWVIVGLTVVIIRIQQHTESDFFRQKDEEA